MADDGAGGGQPAGGEAGANAPAGGGAVDNLTQNPTWITPVFISGIIVGLVLVLLGLGLYALQLAPVALSTMIVCCGLGIVLGAFGATAVLRYQGLVIAGVATTALVLFFVLGQNMDHHLKISVQNVPTTLEATLYIDHAVPGTRSRRNQYDFIILEREIEAGVAQLNFASKEAEVPFECIPGHYVRGNLGSGKTVEWRLADDQQSIRIDGKDISTSCDQATVTSPAQFSLIGAAFAQEPQESIETFLTDLDSDDATLRRGARDGLALWGMDAIPPMMELWAADPMHYRNTLGVAVALTTYLREHKDQRIEVAALFSPADMALLVDALGHSDKTMRDYVSEFLFDLGAEATAAPILEKFGSLSQDGQYLAVFVLTNVAPHMPQEQREALAVALQQLDTSGAGARTKASLTELLATLS